MADLRPRFRGRTQPPPIRARIAAMAVLLLIVVVALVLRSWHLARVTGGPAVVVEVRGEVPDPGYYSLTPPATLRAALEAAGADPGDIPDVPLPPGTRVVLQDGLARLEPIDDPLVVGVRVDINVAGPTLLQALPGIGPAKAANIVAWRTAHGPFPDVDALDDVPGVGPATLELVRPLVTAGE